MSTLMSDLRHGLHVLAKSPGFTAVAVLTLALGIGANTAIFSLVDAVLFRPLPFPDPDRLVLAWEDTNFFPDSRRTLVAPGNFADWRTGNRVFEDMAALETWPYNLTGEGDPEQVAGSMVTANLFQLLGVRPALGRVFLTEEDRPGGAKVVLLSYGLWQRRFGGDATILGKSVLVNAEPRTIVGVMPRSFQFPEAANELWVPAAYEARELASRGRHNLMVVARLKPGIAIGQARADMEAIAQRLARDYPRTNARVGALVEPLRDHYVEGVRKSYALLLAAVGCVLLIGCANLAGLLLSRAAERRGEIAVRTALGASSGRIVRQLLTEALLLSGLGGALGVLLSLWTLDFLGRLVPESLAGVAALRLDHRVFGFAAGASCLTGLLFGLAPALASAHVDLNEALKESGRSGGRGRPRILNVVVVSEVALALVLLAGAGLMIRSFARVRGIDPGFRPENVLTLGTQLPWPQFADLAKRTVYYEEVLRRVRTLPGVLSAGFGTALPLTGGGFASLAVEGRPAEFAARVQVDIRLVSSGFLRTLGVRLLEGRSLDESDGPQSAPVALVNRTLARRLWPGESAIGKRVKTGGGDEPWLTVAGVVDDFKQSSVESEVRPGIFQPYQQFASMGWAPRALAVRTSHDPAALAAAVQREIWAVRKDQPITNVQTMEALLETQLLHRKLQTSLLGAFAGLALLLSMLGIYGVLSYAVAQRTREIGLRIALGARPAQVLGSVMGRGLALAGLGLCLGLAAAVPLARVISSLLFGIGPGDPTTFAAVAGVLLAVSLLGSYVPARRAMRVNPVAALRHE